MKKIALFLFTLAVPAVLGAKTPENIPAELKGPIRQSVEQTGLELLAVEDCPFLLQVFDPKDTLVSPLGLCFYTLEETRGIFKQIACVGVLVEPKSGVKNAFYGSKGHWGVEKACEKDSLLAKLKEKNTLTTINPVTDLRMKVKDGRKVRLLRDELGIWPTLKSEILAP